MNLDVGLLQDTLACLASEEIKLASLKTKQDDDELMEGAEEATQQVVAGVPTEAAAKGIMLAAKQKIISQVGQCVTIVSVEADGKKCHGLMDPSFCY